jgi:hypothetical protein
MIKLPLFKVITGMITVLFMNCPTIEKSNNETRSPETIKNINKDNNNEVYQVPPETYKKTFNDIYIFIEEIQLIMDTKDFDAWVSILTPEYRQKMNDPFYLKEISNEPNLKNKNIFLKNIKDYFLYVFIPSRSGIKMDNIEFLSENKVKVITIVNGIHYVIYLLEKDENNLWKIGVW